MATIRAKRLAVLEDHLKAESAHDMEGVLEGFTADCFNDIAGFPKRFVGPKRVAERYRLLWQAFPDFNVRIHRFLSADKDCIVTENRWTGTHRGPFFGIPPTGRRVRIRSLVAWHFRGDKLWGETVFFDVGSIVKQLGAEIAISSERSPRE
jgi:steroid delta-isomerase-like uncharacterized protein